MTTDSGVTSLEQTAWLVNPMARAAGFYDQTDTVEEAVADLPFPFSPD